MYLNEKIDDCFLTQKTTHSPHPLRPKIMMKYNIITPNRTVRTQQFVLVIINNSICVD